MSVKQRTIAKPVSVDGAGLHTGISASLRVSPAPAGAGVLFIRTDLPHRPTIPALPSSAVDRGGGRRTVLANGAVEIQTVEHLMAALWAVGIDNAYVEVSGPELPGLDGSAAPFVELLRSAGAVEQDAPRKYVTIREPILVEENGSSLAVFPDRELRISYTLSYDHPGLKTQFASFRPAELELFDQQIAPARTFCLYEEAEALRAKGFGKGANFTNTLVVGKDGVMQNTLRFPDEFVRHKVLDLIGDLYLLGAHLRGHVIAIKSGHPLNAKLLHKLAQAMEAWKVGALQSGSGDTVIGPSLDVTQIQQILPHRYPFLLVDRIIEMTETKAVGVKGVTINDYFFQGHFPGRPVMPGVLMVEALAQVGGILILNKPENRGKFAYFMSVDKVKFRKPVVPGDQLILEVELGKMRSRTGQITGKASVDGKVVCEGELMFALAE